MVPGQAQSGKKAVSGYVCSLDVPSISFLFLFCRGEGRILGLCTLGKHWATSPARFVVICSISSVYAEWCFACIGADTTTLASPGRLLACGNTCVEKSACHAFLWERLIEIRTRTPSLTHSRILFTGRGLHQGFLAAYRVCSKSWSRSTESLENGPQPSGKKASEISWPLSKLNTFFFFCFVEGVYALL